MLLATWAGILISALLAFAALVLGLRRRASLPERQAQTDDHAAAEELRKRRDEITTPEEAVTNLNLELSKLRSRK